VRVCFVNLTIGYVSSYKATGRKQLTMVMDWAARNNVGNYFGES